MQLSPLASKVTCYCTENNRNDLTFIHSFILKYIYCTLGGLFVPSYSFLNSAQKANK